MINPAIYLILLLQAKHLVCDGFLQTKDMVDSKGNYGERLGLLHSALHGIGTFLALAIFGAGLAWSLGLAACDMVIHYHVDYFKENVVRRQGWTVADAQFWWALMSDQFLHNLTYLALAAFLLARG